MGILHSKLGGVPMPILDGRSLRQKAANRLESTPNQGKLVLLFACVSAGLFLVTGLVSLLLDGLIAGTGGLGGLQKRSILTTVQAMLNLLLFVFVPFWNLGYISAALKLGHGEAAAETDLLNGFRRFGPALRLILLRLVVNFAVFFVAIQVASIVFSFTPWAQPFYQQLESQSLSDISAGLDAAMVEALIPTMIPYWIIAGVLYMIALIPVTYRLRLAEYRIMDDPQCGALMALLQSNRAMKGNCVAFFKLDLHFWWYYLASALVALLCYGDVLLPMVGIPLPFDAEVGFIVFYVVSQAAQVLLYWRCRNLVECTYVCAYDMLREAQILPPQPSKNVPWNY